MSENFSFIVFASSSSPPLFQLFYCLLSLLSYLLLYPFYYVFYLSEKKNVMFPSSCLSSRSINQFLQLLFSSFIFFFCPSGSSSLNILTSLRSFQGVAEPTVRLQHREGGQVGLGLWSQDGKIGWWNLLDKQLEGCSMYRLYIILRYEYIAVSCMTL